MKRLHVLVEGQTEETFVRDVLGPHLAAFGTAATPVLLKTKRVKSGGAFRGGVTSTEQVLGDIRQGCRRSARSVRMRTRGSRAWRLCEVGSLTFERPDRRRDHLRRRADVDDVAPVRGSASTDDESVNTHRGPGRGVSRASLPRVLMRRLGATGCILVLSALGCRSKPIEQPVPQPSAPPSAAIAPPPPSSSAPLASTAIDDGACDFEHDGGAIADPAAPWSVSLEPFEMLDQGREPRTRLHYSAGTVGDERTFAATIRMRVAMSRGDSLTGWIQLPDFTAAPTVRVIDVSTSASRVRLTQGAVDVGATPEQEPTALLLGKQLSRDNVTDMGRGAHGAFAKAGVTPLEFDIGPSGRSPGVELLANAKGPALLAQSAIVSLPTEAVGVGARWRQRGHVAGAPGAMLEATYSLSELSGGQAVIHSTVAATLDPSSPRRLVIDDEIHEIRKFSVLHEADVQIGPTFPFATYDAKVSVMTVMAECKERRVELTTSGNEVLLTVRTK